jgi:AcrR family transcriptional regulator
MADKTALSRELITETALDVVARDGVGALSMRRLAQELDVWPMSVYRHFRDKEDLLDAVAAAGADDVRLPRAEGSWREQLPALAEEARVLLARQPSELRHRTLLSPSVLSLTDAALRVLQDDGFSPAAAATAWGSVLAYVIGAVTLEAATGTERQTYGELLAASEEDQPAVVEAAAELAQALAGGVAAFDAGLERVLDGVAEHAD